MSKDYLISYSFVTDAYVGFGSRVYPLNVKITPDVIRILEGKIISDLECKNACIMNIVCLDDL